MLGTFTYIMLLIFTMILMGRYYRHFMAKETETQSREVTCSGNTSSKNRVGIQRQLCWIPKPVFFILCSNSDMPTLAESKHTVFINIFQNYIFIFKPIGVSSLSAGKPSQRACFQQCWPFCSGQTETFDHCIPHSWLTAPPPLSASMHDPEGVNTLLGLRALFPACLLSSI